MRIDVLPTSRMEYTSAGVLHSYPIEGLEFEWNPKPVYASERAHISGDDPVFYKGDPVITVFSKTPDGRGRFGNAFLFNNEAKLIIDTPDADYVIQYDRNGGITKTVTRGG